MFGAACRGNLASYDEAPSGVAPEGASSTAYCVIRVSGPGVYGECADR